MFNRAVNALAAMPVASSVLRHRALDAVVVSFGGSGSTFVLQFLRRYLRVNHWNSMKDGIKHADAPDHPILAAHPIMRGVYLYDDPVRAATSLFRRGYHVRMIPKLGCRHATVAEYRRTVDRLARDVSFEDFLSRGEDLFGFERHWHNWTHARPATFPVMCVKFEHLFDHLPEILGFVGLPERYWPLFPQRRERESAPDRLPPGALSSLERMYAPLVRAMAQRPPLFIRSA